MKLPEFNSKKEKFDYLLKNKQTIIDMKKSVVKHSTPFELNTFAQKTVKALNTNYEDDIDSGVIKRDIIGNTYYWMDSHYDVHVGNTFGKSIKERGVEKIYHLHDHVHQVMAKIGEAQSIEEKEMDWADLGVNKQGKTTALVMTSNIMKDYNSKMFSLYLTNKIDQHSVGMIYVKIDLAINDPEYKEEFATWQKYIDLLGNREKAEEVGFFWAVKEAKLIETSAVLEGSNEITPTAINEPSNKDTQSNSDDTADKVSHTDVTEDEERQKKELLKSLMK